LILNQYFTFISVFGGKYFSHLKALENVHRAHLKKLSRDEESGCFFDVEAEFETREENFNFDLYHNKKVEKTTGTKVLCNISEVTYFI
jgi:hypothetical protein